MIRHSSSFFLSLLLHIVILAIVFFIYEGVTQIKKQKPEKKICVKLCMVKKEKKITKLKSKPKKVIKPKPLVKKTIKKKLVKLKPKKIKKYKPKKIKKIKKYKPKKVIKKLKSKPKKIINIIKKEPIVIPKKIEETVVSVKAKDYIKPEVEIQENIPEVEVKSEEERFKEVIQEYLDNHEDEIRQLINDNLYYPRRARKRGVQGKVKVRFTLSKNAKISNIQVLSSKSEILSRAAIKTLKNLSARFPKPSEELHIKIPIVYKLNLN